MFGILLLVIDREFKHFDGTNNLNELSLAIHISPSDITMLKSNQRNR